MIPFTKGDKACSLMHGWGDVIELLGEDRARVQFRDGRRIMFLTDLTPEEPKMPRWNQVLPGDTVEFKVQGDVVEAKARGGEAQPTVLGWKTTELDAIWELLSIKKRNPPVPTHFGAKVEYRGKKWMLIYGAMVITDHPIAGNMIWVEINENEFNWVGHMDINREQFRVTFTGWKTT